MAGGSSLPAPPEIVRWVACHVVPREPAVRAWLRREGVADADADDLVQEAYCRIASLSSVTHVEQPGSYLFQVVRNLRREQLRRQRVVPIAALTDIGISCIIDDGAGPEREALARRELERVLALIERLPERCRRIFTLKRLEGLSQREIAARLGVSESIVENDVMKGLRLILSGLGEERSRARVADTDDRPDRRRA